MAFARRTRVYHVETLVHAERQTTETPWHQEQEEPEQHAYSAQNPRQHAGHTFYVRHDVCLTMRAVHLYRTRTIERLSCADEHWYDGRLVMML